MKRSIQAFTLAILCYGCATTFVVKPVIPINGTKIPLISDVSVFLPDSAAVDIPVGVFSLGPYKQSDMVVLTNSIVQSIAPLQRSKDVSNSTNPKLIVVIRSLVNQYSNKACYMLGCVTYCLADQKGNLLYQEQFYAKNVGHLTAGMTRNNFNKRVTQRILNGLLIFYDGNSQNLPIKDVSDNFEEVTLKLPEFISSSFYSSSGGTGVVVTALGSFTGRTYWQIAKMKDPIDWNTYLNK
jgi:hypothetical protein